MQNRRRNRQIDAYKMGRRRKWLLLQQIQDVPVHCLIALIFNIYIYIYIYIYIV
jgi:hypothetical protein